MIGLDGLRAKGGYDGLQQALDDAERRPDPAGEGLRPARSRRRRVPDGDEVVVRAEGHRQAHLRHRELRRVRAGDLQQPRARRARPAPADRGHGDRGSRDRVPHGVHLHPRRVPVAGDRAAAGARGGLRRRVPGPRDRRQRLRPRHRAAPRGRRLHLRRGDRAAELARGAARSAAPAPAVPRGGGPLRVAHRDQQRRDPDERPRHRDPRRRLVPRARHREVARARRCSRSAARSSGPGNYEVPMGTPFRVLLEESGRRRPRRQGSSRRSRRAGRRTPLLTADSIDVPPRLRVDRGGGVPAGHRRDHGDGRDRLRRGGRRAHGAVLRPRVVRQVHALPRGQLVGHPGARAGSRTATAARTTSR